MADIAAVTVTVNAALVARMRVLETAMRKIMVSTCQCVNCVTLREALESAPSPQPSPRRWRGRGKCRGASIAGVRCWQGSRITWWWGLRLWGGDGGARDVLRHPGWRMGQPFSLTPTLSRWERGKRVQRAASDAA